MGRAGRCWGDIGVCWVFLGWGEGVRGQKGCWWNVSLPGCGCGRRGVGGVEDGWVEGVSEGVDGGNIREE